MGIFTINANNIKRRCKFCNHETTASSIERHEKFCYLNPNNLKICPVCSKPIKNYKTNKTCSHACANTYFRSGSDNPNWKDHGTSEGTYRSTCFLYHKKECVICGEKNVVAVHHMDGDKHNSSPENLIPLCPTHHAYWHSKYRHIIEEQVKLYIKKFKEKYNTHVEVPASKPGPQCFK